MSKALLRRQWIVTGSIWLCALLGFVAVAIPTYYASRGLGRPAVVTGYSLFSIMAFLLIFNLRKRLPMLPLGRAHWWTLTHAVVGILAVALYFLHTGSVWPTGGYEQVLTLLFYGASLSGVFGYVVQRLYPKRLTSRGAEVIYERIPFEIVELRDRAEDVVLQCTRETNSDTLARYYVETFEWYFRCPRFLISHLTGADKSDSWLDHQFSNSRQYLSEHEQDFLDELHTLAAHKNSLDLHFAAQRLLKGWLLVHVPCVVGLTVLVLWHLLIVNIYGL